MKKVFTTILSAFLLGSVSIQAAVKRLPRKSLETATNYDASTHEVQSDYVETVELALDSVEVEPEVSDVQEQETEYEKVVFGQLAQFAAVVNPTFVQRHEGSKKRLIKQLPDKTKEQIFEGLVLHMKNDRIEHPFKAPKGTGYSQLDMFFVLVKELMDENHELHTKLESCIGETDVFKLGNKLNGCLDKTPESVQKLMSIKRLGMIEKVKLFNLIKKRMKTKA